MKANSECVRQYTVKNYESDFGQELKPSFLLGYFQEAAVAHSEEMGMGFDALRRQGRFWVLSKIWVELSGRPHCGEDVSVRTRPHEPNKAIYERSFFLEDAAGVCIARALSRWCVLDAEGCIVPTAQVPHAEMELLGERALSECDWRIGEAAVQGAPAFSLRIANSEYDLNGHVSNIKYADYIFNCFSVEELRARRIRSFGLHFVKQSYEGDRLEFHREETEQGVFLVTGKRGAETVVAAKVCFD